MTAKKALIVDDSRLAQFVLKKMLAAENLDVDTSTSAEEAFDYLKQQKPDVIFLDHTMPGMNGLEALGLIKEDPDTSDIPVLMYTSQEDRTYMDQARELGAVDVLPKELKVEQLQQALIRLNESFIPAANQEEAPLEQAEIVELADVTPLIPEADTSANIETLERLVYDAEEALKYETWQQKMLQKFEKYQQKTDKHMNRLSERLDIMSRDNDPQEGKKRTLWGNLMWLAIYSLTIGVFAAIYFQQQDEITLLSEQSNEQAPPALASQNQVERRRETRPEPIRPAVVAPTKPQPVQAAAASAKPPPKAMESRHLRQLEAILNQDGDIPYDEPLYGETFQDTLEEILTPLLEAGFQGTIRVEAHDGRFCEQVNSDGTYQLAPDEVTVSECQLSSPSVDLEDIASDEFLYFVDNINKDIDGVVVELVPMGADVPSTPYPEDEYTTTAFDWNEVASNNRRLEVQFIQTL